MSGRAVQAVAWEGEREVAEALRPASQDCWPISLWRHTKVARCHPNFFWFRAAALDAARGCFVGKGGELRPKNHSYSLCLELLDESYSPLWNRQQLGAGCSQAALGGGAPGGEGSSRRSLGGRGSGGGEEEEGHGSGGDEDEEDEEADDADEDMDVDALLAQAAAHVGDRRAGCRGMAVGMGWGWAAVGSRRHRPSGVGHSLDKGADWWLWLCPALLVLSLASHVGGYRDSGAVAGVVPRRWTAPAASGRPAPGRAAPDTRRAARGDAAVRMTRKVGLPQLHLYEHITTVTCSSW